MTKFLLLYSSVFSLLLPSAWGEGLSQVEILWKKQNQSKTLSIQPDLKEFPVSFGRITELSMDKNERTRWKGVLLSEVVNNVLSALPLTERSSVDLVVLLGDQGKKVYVPRSLVNKYPVRLAKRKKDPSRGFELVLPLSSHPKLKNEMLPFQNYPIHKIRQITLTDYRDVFSAQYFLDSQEDPIMARGQKRFVQSCLGCHGANFKTWAPELKKFVAAGGGDANRSIASTRHPPVELFKRMKEIDFFAIDSYIKEILGDPSLAFNAK